MQGLVNKEDDEDVLEARRIRIDEDVQKKFSERKWVWIPNEKDSYAGGYIVKESEDGVKVDCGGVIVECRSKDVFRMNPPKFDMVEDLAELSYLNEPSVLHNLKRRYQNGRIYTYSGLFLLAINPYRGLRIYGEKDVKRYTLSKKYELEPHIFAIANEAYRLMVSNGENQSILITGESGAGKTENTKRVVEFLAMVAGYRGMEVDVDRQIIDANPILEAFGNAQTVKNNNSSRFGKFIKIKFNGGNICGAHIEKYLLEKSRVTGQNVNERNYHIFYQLLASSEAMKKLLLLDGEVKDYRYLKGSRYTIPDVDDGEEFKRLVEAMDVLRIDKDEQMGYFRIVSAILHLGNIEFGEKDGVAEIVNLEVAEKACRLLNISLVEFIKRLIHPMIKAGNEYVMHERNKEQVVKIVDGLSRILYDKMFDGVVERINLSLSSRHKGSFIGVLDIAGFEIFEKNSFEQFCINYTNEKLQQFFNHHMFILEQEVYRQEDIEWDFIDFGLDLQPTIDLIEKSNPIGILSYLDEECVMPMATEKTFLGKLSGSVRHNKFEVDKIRDVFILNHYAGNVEYSVQEWLSKNKDPHSEALTSLIQTSEDGMVSKLSLNETQLKKGFFRTVSQKHKEQLGSLMQQLQGTNPHFVRCIIPNLEKSGEYLSNALVLDQLRCNGVLEGIRISRQGFPSRMRYEEFVGRYKILMGSVDGDEYLDGGMCMEYFRNGCRQILDRMGLGSNQYRLGISKVFFRQGVLADIEDMKESKVSEVVKEMQALIRKRLVHRRYNLEKRRMHGVEVIQRNARVCCEIQRWSWWRLYQKIKPLLDVKKKDDELKGKEAEIQECVRQLEMEKERGVRIEESLKREMLRREEMEKNVEEEKRYSAEKEELLMALRRRIDELENEEMVLKETNLKTRQDADENKRRVEEYKSEYERLCKSKVQEYEEIAKYKNEVMRQMNVISEQERRMMEMREELISKSSENDARVERMLNEGTEEILRLGRMNKEKEEEIEQIRKEQRETERSEEELRKEKKAIEEEIVELRIGCANGLRWREELMGMKKEHEMMQRKLKDEVEDVQLENERLEDELKKEMKKVEEMKSMRKKAVDEVDYEKSRGDKLERMYQEEKKLHEEAEEQLQREKMFKDATQESLLEKIKGLKKSMKEMSEKLKGEEMMNKQLMAEKEDVCEEIRMLQQSKLDEIFDREAGFNSVRKGLQMEIQRLERENQKLSMDLMEMKAMNDVSEESVSGAEKMYAMLEEERKKRKEVEYQVSEQESRNVMLSSEVEMLKEMIEIEKRGREEMMKDQEKDLSVCRSVKQVKKEVDELSNELSVIVDGFNVQYVNVLNGYKEEVRRMEKEAVEKEIENEKMKIEVIAIEEKNVEMKKQMLEYEARIEKKSRMCDAAMNEMAMHKEKSRMMEESIWEKEEEVKRYVEKFEEWNVLFEGLVSKVEEEVKAIENADEERRKMAEEMKRWNEEGKRSVSVLEERYTKEMMAKVKDAIEEERRKMEYFEGKHLKLLKKYEEMEEKQQNLIEKHALDALRIERLEAEKSVYKENEMRNAGLMSMYESEINTLKRCTRFKEEVLMGFGGANGSVVYVNDKEKYCVQERRRIDAEQEMHKMSEEKQAQMVVNKRLREEVERLRGEIEANRLQSLEMKKRQGVQMLTISRLSKELDEEREMAKLLRSLKCVSKKARG
ncbi:myosin heavy chain [Ordospora colligata]|nr:myosin heavy chain [Ordospora colligata]